MPLNPTSLVIGIVLLLLGLIAIISAERAPTKISRLHKVTMSMRGWFGVFAVLAGISFIIIGL